MKRKMLGYWQRIVCWRQGHVWDGWVAEPSLHMRVRTCCRCGRQETLFLDESQGSHVPFVQYVDGRL